MTNKRGRDADNGQFIPVKVAERRTKTEIVETFTTEDPAAKERKSARRISTAWRNETPWLFITQSMTDPPV